MWSVLVRIPVADVGVKYAGSLVTQPNSTPIFAMDAMLHDERNAADGGRILELCQWTSLTRVCRHHCSSQHCLLFFVSLDHGRDPSTNMVIIDDGFDVLRSKYSVNIDLHISNHHIPTRTRTHTSQLTSSIAMQTTTDQNIWWYCGFHTTMATVSQPMPETERVYVSTPTHVAGLSMDKLFTPPLSDSNPSVNSIRTSHAQSSTAAHPLMDCTAFTANQ